MTSLCGRCKRLVLWIGAILGFLHAYAVPVYANRGPGGLWWEPIRRRCSHVLGASFDENAGPRRINEREYVGRLDSPPELVEGVLWRRGLLRNPFARLKTNGGHREIGSWVYRPAPLAKWQVHIMLFETGSDGTDVYAHMELSNVNPRFAPDHFHGSAQDGEAGVAFAKRLLADQEWLTVAKPELSD